MASRTVQGWAAIALLGVPHLVGCYHYAPIPGSAIRPGSEISVRVTDRARIELNQSVGPGVRRINGRVTNAADSAVSLAVSSVRQFDVAAPTPWTGERITLPRDWISEVGERRLSRSRSAIAAGLVVAAAIAASTLAITGFGSGESSDRPGGGEPGQQ